MLWCIHKECSASIPCEMYTSRKCKGRKVKPSYYLARIFCVVNLTSWYELVKFWYFFFNSWKTSVFPSMIKVVFFILWSFLFHFFAHHFLNSRKFRCWNIRLQHPWIFLNHLCDWFFIYYLGNRWEVKQTSTCCLCNFIFNHLCDWFFHLLSL